MATPDTREFLAAHEVFTVDEFRDRLDPSAADHSVWLRLSHAKERGWVDRVTRGVYVSRVGVFAARQPDPLVVASKLAADAVLVYHSALEASGVAHSAFFQATVASVSAPRSLTFRDVEYRRVRERPQLNDASTRERYTQMARRGDYLVRTTSRERTIVDCLDRPDLSGGLEEVLRSVGGFPSLRVDDVLGYLDLLDSPTATSRVAWALFAVPDQWLLTEQHAERFRKRLGRGPYYLARSKRAMRFVNEWRLYVPADVDAKELLNG